MNPQSSPLPAVVLDASVMVAVVAKEAQTAARAATEINRYLAAGCEFYAPGVIVSETLYVLCGKLQDGSLSIADHALAIQDFSAMALFVRPAPQGDISLVLRAEAIRGNYTCRRSADGIYIALAEQLSHTRQTTLLTLDVDMPRQAARNAPGVSVQLIVP